MAHVKSPTPDESVNEYNNFPWSTFIDYDSQSSSFSLSVFKNDRRHREWHKILRSEVITCDSARYHVGDVVDVEVTDKLLGTRQEPAVIAEYRPPFLLVIWLHEVEKRKELLESAQIASGFEFILTTHTDIIYKCSIRDRISSVEKVCMTAVLHFKPRKRIIKLQGITHKRAGNCYIHDLVHTVYAEYSSLTQVPFSGCGSNTRRSPNIHHESPSSNKTAGSLSGRRLASTLRGPTPQRSRGVSTSHDIDYESTNDDVGNLEPLDCDLTTLGNFVDEFGVEDTPKRSSGLSFHLSSLDFRSPASSPTPRASSPLQMPNRRSPAETSDRPQERPLPAEASPSKTPGFEVLPPDSEPPPSQLSLTSIRLLEASMAKNIESRQNFKANRYIYVFTAPKMPDLVKVGIAEDVGKRRRDLERNCKLETVELQYMSKSLCWAPLAERLIHAVLKAWNMDRTVRCLAEKRNHREWFACGKEATVELVKIWSEALEYDERGNPERWLIEKVGKFRKDGGPLQDYETWDQMIDRHQHWFGAAG